MSWLNLPNAITLGRIVLAVVAAPLILTDGFWIRIAAFTVFLVAAVSDLVDGRLARSRNLITDFGKLADPLADKLLLAATFFSFFALSHWLERETPFPWWGGVLPLWVMVVIFGREIFITVFRGFAAKRGVVLAAGTAGKLKAVFQSIATGAVILWYAAHSATRELGWDSAFWTGFWLPFHRWFSIVSLGIAVALTVWSLIVYLRTFARLDLQKKGGGSGG
jgi:CDP-diacylglycerol---glycerol-3-phosphate 3-phosphatidyltransferase